MMQNEVLAGMVLATLVEAAKRSQHVPLKADDVPTVRALVLFSATLAGVALSVVEGPQAVAKLDLPAVLTVLGNTGAVLVSAVGSYYAVWNKR